MLHRSKSHTTFVKLEAFLIGTRLFSPPVTPKPTPSSSHLPCNLNKASIHQWNSILKDHVDSGLFDEALSIFSSLRSSGARPDHLTLPLVNRAVSSLTRRFDVGEAVHCLGIRMGFCNDAYFCNTMIELHVRYGSICSARQMFDEMCVRDVVSWTSMISGYVQIGDCREASWLFHEMRMDGCGPSPVTLAIVLRACLIKKDSVGGRQLHGFAVKSGFEGHELVENSILTLLTKVGILQEAMEFFSRIQKRSVVSWNIMISGYSSVPDISKVIDLYEKMKVEMNPSFETLTSVLSALTKCRHLRQGKKLHCVVVKIGFMDVILHASLLDLYAKCGELASSVRLFEEFNTKCSTTRTVMMWGFIQNGQFREAIDLFWRMQNEGFEPTAHSLQGLVVTYTHLGALQFGKGIHGYIIRSNFVADSKSLETSILNMYANCGSIDLARRCFDRMADKDIIAWSSMIDGYAIHGYGIDALALFHQMQEEGIKPNSVTFLNALSACSHSGLVNEARKLFGCMIEKFGIIPELTHYTCMVDVLGRSGNLDEALGIINSMNIQPDGRIWGALLASCRIHSDVRIAIYAAQKLLDLEPNNIGYHVVLSNIQASNDKWNQVENIRKFMREKEFRKKPAWSCIEGKQGLDLFVAGDRSHPLVGEIYEVLGCLAKQIEENRAM
ncbi:pentatricopeptide repeat-containing protein At4g35130, chloroplastic-like [Typha angustifolia]|uniref:pentatricopeptide repeat-containing protein At4g35130, chloroplastic-like n=1 Tax=Typha angustifolia TaxID=59011 RepID=UPI003C2B4D76